MPDLALLERADGVKIKKIVQTYLKRENEKNARVRKIDENGKISYIKTVKQRISTLSAYEDEREIDEIAYINELTHTDTTKRTIVKTRYCVPFDRHVVEIDVYPFWNDRAILEVELSSEDEHFSLPDYVRVIKEVSDDGRYKNTKLAEYVPEDEIQE
jgi:CYTH domain-containing protein